VKLLFTLGLLLISAGAHATEDGGDQDSAQANNPLADIQAFNLQNYYIPELSDGVEGNANSFILRYAQPFGRWLMRASLPFNRVPTGPDSSTSGVGDLDAFFAYLFDTGNPARSFGIGPQIALPTASEDATGTGKYQLGAAAVYFDATSARFQWGGLVTYRTDVAGDEDRDDTSLLAVQPFYFLQLGNGNYLRGAPIWTFDLESDDYAIPVGLGFGKVIPTERVVFNVFIEPQFTVLSKGSGQPELQLFLGFNMQFK
jgi:hypothetical protein